MKCVPSPFVVCHTIEICALMTSFLKEYLIELAGVIIIVNVMVRDNMEVRCFVLIKITASALGAAAAMASVSDST